MLSNCDAREDSWESLGPQGKKLGNHKKKLTLNIHWKDWFWRWSSNTPATWCKESTYWKRPWCWESLKAGGINCHRGWDSWRASPTQWTEFKQNLGYSEGQGSLVCYSPWGHKESDTTQHLNNNNEKILYMIPCVIQKILVAFPFYV